MNFEIKLPLWKVVLLAAGAFVAFGPPLPDIGLPPWLHWPVIGSTAPYPCPPDKPVTVAYAIDGSLLGTQALGKSHAGVLAAIQLAAGAGNYAEIDVTTVTAEPSNAADWVKAAYAALDKTKTPQWVASGPRGGWKSKAWPTKPEEATAAVKGIMKP